MQARVLRACSQPSWRAWLGKVAHVKDEGAMVDVMVAGGAEAEEAEEPIPRVMHLGMDQAQPRRPGSSEGHVFPHVCVEQLGGDRERDEDHAKRVLRTRWEEGGTREYELESSREAAGGDVSRLTGTDPSKASKRRGLRYLWCGLCERW